MFKYLLLKYLFEESQDRFELASEGFLEKLQYSWPFLVLGYVLGLVVLDSYCRHTGVTISSFWMYEPILPLVAGYLAFALGLEFLDWADWGKKKARNATLVLVVAFGWPLLVWNFGQSNQLFVQTRFWPLMGMTATLLGAAFVELVLRRMKKAQMKKAA